MTIRDSACWICALPPELGARTRVLARMTVGPGRARDFVEIRMQGVRPEGLDRAIRVLPSVQAVSISEVLHGRLYGIVENVGCTACTALEQNRIFLLASAADGAGNLECDVISPSRAGVSDLLAVLLANGCETMVRRVGRPSPSEHLTTRQQEVLKVARDCGFFDDPRRATLGDLASRLGVSRSAGLRILRRAERSSFFLL